VTERAVLVARVSSTGQDEDNQIPDLEAWSDDHSYVIADTIRIHGKSAFHGHHKAELNKAVRMIESGLADLIVMWTLDRASRQGIDAAFRFRFSVQDAGGRIEFTEYPELNGDSQDAQKAWAEFADEAHRESEKRIRRIKTGYRAVVKNGSAARRPKFGYNLIGSKRNKEWTIDEPVAAIIREIFARAVNGETLSQIVEWAVSADPERYWDTTAVRKIIIDTAYYGKARTKVNGEPYTYDCPEIVDLETWQRANAELKKPRRFVRTPESKFAGIVRCGNCGTVRLRTSTNGNRKCDYRYWRCRNKCGNIRYELANERIENALRSIKVELVKEEIVKDADMRQVRLTVLNAELAEIGRKGYSPAEMIKRITEISEEIESVKAETPPRGRIVRSPAGVTVADAYSSLDHSNPALVNAWLKAYNVRVWFGGNSAEIMLKESNRLDSYGQHAYVEAGMVVTWWLTQE
jgi:DNA invertase Pin-like site-specific DNA recombinase